MKDTARWWIRLKEKILVHRSPSPGAFFYFTVFMLFLGFGVFCVFFCVFWCFLVLLDLFLDSSRFSASIASVFVEKH